MTLYIYIYIRMEAVLAICLQIPDCVESTVKVKNLEFSKLG